ncbi:putative movement protein [Chrysanthemum yellow dwarf virus]|uniref:Movement protein n=1 Tax=chrysanthemum yellow dwarf associated virus TaxID=3070829 RepID=A0AAE7QP13_9RHAB|nr:putative movement protein [Chrysanthemum yellow dwarf virus]QRX38978.1 putative movement protein [Chrysanthemum yellow dwarf virus]
MPSTISYKVEAEVRTGADNNVVPLTKKFSLFQKMNYLMERNVRIRNLNLIYRPRTGSRGKGIIKASIIDNRIDPDLDDRVINMIEFDATQQMNANWSSLVWLPKSEFINTRDPPIICELELTECNLTAGYSVGHVTLVVEISASDGMEKFTYKNPTAKLQRNPYTLRAKDDIHFALRGDTPMSITEAPRSQSMRVPNRETPVVITRETLTEIAHQRVGDRRINNKGLRLPQNRSLEPGRSS